MPTRAGRTARATLDASAPPTSATPPARSARPTRPLPGATDLSRAERFHHGVVTTARRVRVAGIALIAVNALALSIEGWSLVGLPLWAAALAQSSALGIVNVVSVVLDRRLGLGHRRRLIESTADVAAGLVVFGVLAPMHTDTTFAALYVVTLALVAVRVRTVHAMWLALVLGGGTSLLRLIEPFPWSAGAPTGDVGGFAPLVLASLLVAWAVRSIVELLAATHDPVTAAARRATETETELLRANAVLRVEATDHRRTLARLEEEVAVQAHHREAYERFATVVAHDLKSPLASLSGIAQILGKDLAPADTTRMLATLRNSAERASGLVDRLLEHARVGTVQVRPEPTDLGAAAREVVSDLTAAVAAAGATVTVDPALPSIDCDPVLVRQLIANLTTNALVHARRPDRGPRVHIGGSRTDDGVRLTVSDDGPGIAAAVADDAFTVGVRDGRGAGLGLGLTTCRTIAERHGGSIGLETSSGGGCTVVVHLPAGGPSTGAPPSTPTVTVGPRTASAGLAHAARHDGQRSPSAVTT